jgi:tetratricopeptide (TPR) repeat protein
MALGAAFAALLGGLLWLGWEAGWQSPRHQASTLVRDAETARQEGKLEQAIRRYSSAEDSYRNLLGSRLPQPDRAALRLALARVQTCLGEVREEARESDAAVAALTDARQALEDLRAGDPDRAEYTLLLAEVRHNMGVCCTHQKKPEKAKEHFQAGLDLRVAVWPSQQESREYRRDLARSYGYLGDAELVLGEFDKAWENYAKAEELREPLARELVGGKVDIEARCLHARDFGNKAGYHERQGNMGEAVKYHKVRLEYYRTKLLDKLPGAFLTERADTKVELAGLELDRPNGDLPSIPGLLDEAETEYAWLLEEDPEAAPLKAGLAQIHVTRGTYHHRQGNRAKAEAELDMAHSLLQDLENKKRMRPDDYYNRAVVHALRLALLPSGKARAGSKHTAKAVEDLKQAVEKGFNHRRRLERDPRLAALRRERPKEFQRILDSITGPKQAS